MQTAEFLCNPPLLCKAERQQQLPSRRAMIDEQVGVLAGLFPDFLERRDHLGSRRVVREVVVDAVVQVVVQVRVVHHKGLVRIRCPPAIVVLRDSHRRATGIPQPDRGDSR